MKKSLGEVLCVKRLRFRKRVRLHKFLAVNLSKSGFSVSVGGRGLTFNLGRAGLYVTLSAPRTGWSYRARVPLLEAAFKWAIARIIARAKKDSRELSAHQESEGDTEWISSNK